MGGGKADITVVLDGEYTGTPSYQWYYNDGYYDEEEEEWIDVWTRLEGETNATYTAATSGYHACAVSLDEGVRVQEYYVYDEEYDWEIFEYGTYVSLPYGEKKTISVETNYTGTKEIAYQWFKDDLSDETDHNWVIIEGADSDSYEIEEVGYFRCEVTIDGQTQDIVFTVEYDTDDYERTTLFPSATATYKADRTLVIDYINGNNFPKEGDSIVVLNDGIEDEYYYDGRMEDNLYFVNDDDEYLDLSWDEDTDVDAAKGKVRLWICSDSEINHDKKSVTRKYEIETYVNAVVNSDVKSIKYEPGNIKIYSEDIKEIYPDGSYDFNFYNRRKFKSEDGEEWSTFAVPGDAITVNYADGRTLRYTYDAKQDDFVNGDNSLWVYPENTYLQPGNNVVKFWYHGISTSVNVYMETPEMRAKAEADKKAADELKEWNGTVSKAVPAVKSAKFKAAKKKVTVSWKKATKKNLKKFDKVEIQVCKDKKFQKVNTTRVEVKKSKKSATVKKLKKGTYYVRVRNVKGSGVNKQVSKWSKVKKVKVK